MREYGLVQDVFYGRLHPGNTVYLLKNSTNGYSRGSIPSPLKSEMVYTASVTGVDKKEYRRGVNLKDVPDTAGFDPTATIHDYNVSPKEVFLYRELIWIIKNRTNLPPLRPSQFNRALVSKSEAFRKTLAPEMARVVLERFGKQFTDDITGSR